MVEPLLPLRVTGGSVRLRGKHIVGPVDLELSNDGFTIVMGPNGAGKTTLLRMIHGLARLSEGNIAWNIPLKEARMRQAFVSQTPAILRRTVVDNIAFPLQLRGKTRNSAREKAAAWAEKVGLGSALKRQAMVLSGGEKQKLAIGRALILEPDLLFLDEPTANLDGQSMQEIETILKDAQANGTRIIMATHNVGQARRLASDVMFIYRGLIHERQEASRFFEAPETEEARTFIRGDILQ